MILSEYHGKELLRGAGTRAPRGVVAETAEQAASAAVALGGPVAIKAQIAAGRRGKAGGVRFAADPDAVQSIAAGLLATSICGFPVRKLLIEERIPVARELYAAVMNDAQSKSPLVLFSTEGGIDIEELGATRPERIVRRSVDIRRGLGAAEALDMLSGTGLDQGLRERVAEVLVALYAQYRAFDLELLEVNPLALDRSGTLWALDCKLSLDDAAKARHSELVNAVEGWLGESGTELERRGRAHGLLYIELEGDVGVLANGAGLTMATLDAVAYHGGRAANFVEIGGDAYTKAMSALELVLADPHVKSIVVNFCGAFARTDVMTEGVIRAVGTLRPALPMFFSIHGTGEESAQAMLRERLRLEPYDLMDDAIRAAVDAAQRAAVSEVSPS